MAINLRSPHFVSITDANISYATLDIYVWDGDKVATTTVKHNLKKDKVIGSTTVSFEISELIRDYLEIVFDGVYSTTSQSICKWVKTDLKAFNISDVQQGTTVSQTDLALDSYSYFQEGSSYSFDNKSLLMNNVNIYLEAFSDFQIPIYVKNNPSIAFVDSSGVTQRTVSFTSSSASTEQVESVSLFPQLVTNVTFDVPDDWQIQTLDVIEDGVLRCNGELGSRNFTNFTPIAGNEYIVDFEIKEYTSGNIRYYDGSGGVQVSGILDAVGEYSFSYTQSVTGANLVSFYSPLGFDGVIDNVSLKEVTQVSKVVITDDNDITTLNIKEQCKSKYTSNKVTFVNKFGTLQDMYFFKKATEMMTVKKESYKANVLNNSNSYSASEHVNQDFNILGKESITLSSGYLDESYNEVFKQLMLSEKVWITDEDYQVTPINIKTSSLAYKTSLNDKLVDYKISFDKSFDTINNVR